MCIVLFTSKYIITDIDSTGSDSIDACDEKVRRQEKSRLKQSTEQITYRLCRDNDNYSVQ